RIVFLKEIRSDEPAAAAGLALNLGSPSHGRRVRPSPSARERLPVRTADPAKTRKRLLTSRRERLAVGEPRVPRPQRVAHEDAVLVERVGLQQLLRLLGAGRLVDDEGAAAVGERPGHGELAALAELREVLAVDGAERLDLLGVGDVLDDGRV